MILLAVSAPKNKMHFNASLKVFKLKYSISHILTTANDMYLWINWQWLTYNQKLGKDVFFKSMVHMLL